jgi:hypothetical protein
MKKIFLLGFSFMVFNSCIELPEKSNNSSDSISGIDFKTISVEKLYQLDVPKYMKEMPSLHPEASLEYANIYKEAYVIVIHEDKEEFIDVFTEIDEYDTNLSVVENYKEVQKKLFAESIASIKTEDYELTNINGHNARQIKVFGKVDGLDVSYVVAFIEGDENIYMIMNWTIDNRFKRFKDTFEYINSTFKIPDNYISKKNKK